MMNAATSLGNFKGCIEIEGLHPLEGGLFRRRFRRDRRPDRPLEPAWRFYPRHYADMAGKAVRWAALWLRIARIFFRVCGTRSATSTPTSH